MKYLIVGGVAGGATVAARLRRNDEKARSSYLKEGNTYHTPIVVCLITLAEPSKNGTSCLYRPLKGLSAASVLTSVPVRK